MRGIFHTQGGFTQIYDFFLTYKLLTIKQLRLVYIDNLKYLNKKRAANAALFSIL